MLAYIKFGDQSKNCQTAKLKSLLNVLHIRYAVAMYIIFIIAW